MSSQMVTADRLDFQRGVQTDPLTDRDIQMIHRYLSDPTVFPREFKKWITDHASDTVDIAKTQVHGLVNNTGQVVIGSASMGMLGAVLCGCVLPYAGGVAPSGWLLCDWTEYAQTEYSALYALIGTSWGPAAAGKFRVPDFRRRVPVGAGPNKVVGLTDGQTDPNQRDVVHKHTVNDPGHAHLVQMKGDESAAGYNTPQGSGDDPNTQQQRIGSSYTGISVGPQGNVPTDAPSHAFVNFIIGSGRVPQ